MGIGQLLGVLAAAVWLALTGGPGGAQTLGALARLDPAASSIRSEDGGITLRLALSQPVPYRTYFLADPPRLVVEFAEVDFGSAPASGVALPEAVRGLAWGPIGPGWSRLVAVLDGPYRLASATEDTGRADGRAAITLRIRPTDAAGFVTGAPPAPDRPRPAADLPEPKRRQTGEAPLVVVLDPGHGGLDPGAESDGTSEARLMLAFGQELAEVLRRAGMTVILTREKDVFVPLETRISVARAAGADLFLSLHADALAEGEATGATVYRLAETASEAAAAKLAERHDRADLLAGVDLSGHDDTVAGVLMDLARTETQPRADRLAADLVAAIRAEGLKMHRRPIQGAAFSVLKSPDIPSLLLEVGFLSSPADRKRLADPAWRAAMQRAILTAIRSWALADAAEARLIRQ